MRVLTIAAVLLAGAAAAQDVDTSALLATGSRVGAGVVLPSARLLDPGQWEVVLGLGFEGGVVRANLPTGSVRGTSFTSTRAWIDNRTVSALQLA